MASNNSLTGKAITELPVSLYNQPNNIFKTSLVHPERVFERKREASRKTFLKFCQEVLRGCTDCSLEAHTLRSRRYCVTADFVGFQGFIIVANIFTTGTRLRHTTKTALYNIPYDYQTARGN